MMTKELVRGDSTPAGSEVLGTSEFMTVALEQIARSAQSVIDSNEAEPVLDAMSDILDLMCSYLIAKNIDPSSLFEHAEEIRNTKGSFDKKVAVSKD